ncbi:hypothetical protein Pan153_52990 [Gimesia panareensis]|uniref:Uncharacterized protein n=1 Tax=Gimesia panareensis TaxID=2527978 RepID=A0A518FW80_9PLAN|nr:2OG-Fe(II) oxygenase [Gimesia panareensis]QDV20623.1 hypothetical protein Pan153_52990 [Gimesia panareensis]
MDFENKTPSAAEQQLLDALGNLTESISFSASGKCPFVLPGLTIDGIGEIAFPVSKTGARSLIKQARQAPYGRGEATIVDTDVRRVWQLEPDQFRLENPQWQSLVCEVANSVKSEFGIKQNITANLYKLLIYEKGSFFAPHRDTEKLHRMFATLVICLPSKHTGGQLIISHAGQSQIVDFGGKTLNYDLQYAAFYADCEHEIRPVTDGYRICLVYNLTLDGRRKQPVAPEFSDSIESATTAVETIFKENDLRDMLVLPLLHQYTEAGLTPDDSSDATEDDDEWDDDWEDDEQGDPDDETRNDVPRRLQKRRRMPNSVATSVPLQFKGADRARTDVLAEVAARANCRAFVALLTHWQAGYPDYNTIDYSPYGGQWGHGYEDVSNINEQAEFEDILDESISLQHWHTLDGKRQPFYRLFVDEGDIVSDWNAEGRSYRQQVHEATGNAGMSMERWYHQAVIVLWPEERHFQILASQGIENSVPALSDLVAVTENPAQCEDCKTFARLIIDHWVYPTHGRPRKTNSPGTSMIRSLLAIGDDNLAQKFFEQVLPLEYPTLDGESLLALAELARWGSIEKSLLSFFESQKPDDYDASLRHLVSTFSSLASLRDGVSSSRKRVCKSVLKEVMLMISRWEDNQADSMRYGYPPNQSKVFQGVVEPLVRGVCSVGTQSDLKSLLTQIADRPQHYDLHKVLIPAIHKLSDYQHFTSSGKMQETALFKLRQFCIDQVKRRAARKPIPPGNWKRKANLDCDCADCRELATFLKDNDSPIHRFPRRTELRQHLHRQIERHRIDCTHITERRGRPYTLVCTKTQASFERDLAQYKTDCKLLKELTEG